MCKAWTECWPLLPTEGDSPLTFLDRGCSVETSRKDWREVEMEERELDISSKQYRYHLLSCLDPHPQNLVLRNGVWKMHTLAPWAERQGDSSLRGKY